MLRSFRPASTNSISRAQVASRQLILPMTLSASRKHSHSQRQLTPSSLEQTKVSNRSTSEVMDADAFRTAAHAAIEEIIAHSQNVSTGSLPVLPAIKPGYLAPQLPKAAPSKPESWQTIQPDIASKIIPGLTNWQSPNFMAFFPACMTYPSILGEMYSAAFTAPAFNWLCSPACTELETVVLDWLADALHLPKEFRSDGIDGNGESGGGGGVIQGSASEAIVTVMVAARERYLNRRADEKGLPDPSPEREKFIMEMRPRLVALSSDQAHSSTAKGAIIAGTYHRTVKTLWKDELGMTAENLQATIDHWLGEGLEPYYITVSYGTTSTCAVDALNELAPVLKKYPDIWVHIDAAYAGTALVCPEYTSTREEEHPITNGTSSTEQLLEKMTTANGAIPRPSSASPSALQTLLSQQPLTKPDGALLAPSTLLTADSFNTNMHKWLLTSFDASLLFLNARTRARESLTTAMSITPAYLQNKHTDSGLVTDYRDWQIPLGRRFRALKIWFVVRSYGIQGLRGHIRWTVRVGQFFEGLVTETEEGRELFELVSKPAFGLTCFRIRPDAIRKALSSISTQDIEVADTTEAIETKTTINESPFGTVEQQENGTESSQPAQSQDAEELANTLTRKVTETINDKGQLFLTSSTTHDKSFIRLVCGNTNANEEAVKNAFETIVAETRKVLSDLKEQK